jgi:hypothetical protein
MNQVPHFFLFIMVEEGCDLSLAETTDEYLKEELQNYLRVEELLGCLYICMHCVLMVLINRVIFS